MDLSVIANAARRAKRPSRRHGPCLIGALAACGTLWLTACDRPVEPVHQEQVLTLGTLVDISIWGADATTAQQASTAVIGMLNELHRRWHTWQPGPLTDINQRLARGVAVTLTAEQVEVIRGAQLLS